MGGTIIIEDLVLFGHHGVCEQEKVVGNYFEYSVRLKLSDVPALESDSLDGTISYADVINIIKVENALPSKLLEHVAGRIYRRLCESYPQITGGTIEIYKPAPPVSAELRRAGFRLDW